MVDTLGYSIAEFPVRILRIPAGKQSCSPRDCWPRCCSPTALAPGRQERSGRAVPWKTSGVTLLQPHQVRQLDRVLDQIDVPSRPRPPGTAACSANSRTPPSSALSMEH